VLLSLNSFPDLISILSAAEIVEPPNIEPPIPTPPDTVKAPVVVFVDAVVDLIDTPVPTISIGILEELSIPNNIPVLPTRLKIDEARAKAELGGTTLKRVNCVDPMPNSPPYRLLLETA
jgi:hypothetical protein